MVAGFLGLIAMAALGFAHVPGGHRVHAKVHARMHAKVQARAAHAPGQAQAPAARMAISQRGLHWIAPLISPLNWFAWMFGGGVAGTVLQLAGVHGAIVAAAAVAGAAGFHLAVLMPVWNLVSRFESRPAGNLEACVLQEVEAVTAFNASGEGLVRVVVDGRSEDVLARLTDDEKARESRPRKGDRLVIQEVDSSRNTCRVSRGGA